MLMHADAISPKAFAAKFLRADAWGRLIDKKNARRYDDCISYSLVSAKKVLLSLFFA